MSIFYIPLDTGLRKLQKVHKKKKIRKKKGEQNYDEKGK